MAPIADFVDDDTKQVLLALAREHVERAERGDLVNTGPVDAALDAMALQDTLSGISTPISNPARASGKPPVRNAEQETLPSTTVRSSRTEPSPGVAEPPPHILALPPSLQSHPSALRETVRGLSAEEKLELRTKVLRGLRSVKLGKNPHAAHNVAQEQARRLVAIIDGKRTKVKGYAPPEAAPLADLKVPKKTKPKAGRTDTKKGAPAKSEKPGSDTQQGPKTKKTADDQQKAPRTLRSVRTYKPTPTYPFPVHGRTVSGGLPSLGRKA